MEASLNTLQRTRVQEFLRKHRIGLLTLLFTDIVGSTKLKQSLGDAEAVMHIKQHHEVVRGLLKEFPDAEEISTAGDSFFVVFARPSDALKFALYLQSGLRDLAQNSGIKVLDRVGIHVGEVVIDPNHFSEGGKDLYGIQVDNCARIMSLAEGDQILMSRVVFDNARQVLRGQELRGLHDLRWLNHGIYLMKGIEDPVEVCEVGEANLAVLAPPADTEKAKRRSDGAGDLIPGWRPALDLLVPNTKWILEEKLGEGGFGEVWLGRHETLKERRVFKFCFSADRVRSLKREVTLFRVLRERLGGHPNIAGIQEVFFDAAPYYVVMEYAHGKDLKSWSNAKDGIHKIPISTRLEIIAQVADGLQAAHSAGVIHRDIKPGNILVHESGDPSAYGVGVKLTDFGIGQVVSEEALAGVTRAGFTETLSSGRSSYQPGTHLYMAPELAAGHHASARTDVYSLGVVLYQMMVGDWSRPVTMDWRNDIGDKFTRDILTRCFAGNPNDRFASCAELAHAVRSVEKRWAIELRLKSAINALLTISLGLCLLATPVGNTIRGFSYGLIQYWFPSPVPADAVVVEMDESSYRELNQPLTAKWNRSLHAQLLDRLKSDGASVAVFDVLFSARSMENPQGDEDFARAIKRFGNVVLGASKVFGNKFETSHEMFLDATKGIGVVEVSPDSDGAVRRWHEFSDGLPSLAGSAFEHAKLGSKVSDNGAVQNQWLNYYSRSGRVDKVSYHKALSTDGLPPGYFREKAVFIGSGLVSSFSGDRRTGYTSPIPFGDGAHMFVPSVHLNAIRFLNLVHGDWFRRFPPLMEFGACVLLGTLLGVSNGYLRTRSCVLLALCWAGIVFATVRLLHAQHIWYAWLIPLLQIGFSLAWTFFTSRFGELCYEKRPDGTLVGYVFRFSRSQRRGS